MGHTGLRGRPGDQGPVGETREVVGDEELIPGPLVKKIY